MGAGMGVSRFVKRVAGWALLMLAGLSSTATAAENFKPGVGIADPAIAINASGFVKWGQTTNAPFIDRMKGAFAWTGRLPNSRESSDSVVMLTDPSAFAGKGPTRDVTLRDDTVIDLYRLVVTAVFNKKLISREQNQQIRRTPEAFFNIETGPDGRSLLVGRLRESDPFVPLVRFDRNIGMNLGALRAKGHVQLTQDDLRVPIHDLTLDENGWPTRMPTDLAGRKGTVSTAILWYPAQAAKAPDSIYSGTFYLLADGQGTLSLDQRGDGAGLVSLKDVRIDGPTALEFEFRPNGQRVNLTISDTDPAGTGEYLRSIRIVHERHLPLFEAGEIFTPEYTDFMADFRVIRWMQAMEGPRNPPFFEGRFEDRPKPSYYSFNLGTNGTDRNGFPIDTIVAFSNKTGTDPWITVPDNVSDAFAKGMAVFIAANLHPDRKLYVELGNEIWNGIFPSYQYAAESALRRWGELKVRIGPDGKPAIARPGRFVSDETVRQSGASSSGELTELLGLKHPLLDANGGWSHWAGMRATQVGKIFEDAFAAADTENGKRRLHNVMGAWGAWAESTDVLMQAKVWRQEEPENWIDPATVFESIAAGAYFGGYMGSRHSDLVSYWIETMGQEGAKRMALRHLTAGLDPDKPYIQLDQSMIARSGRVNPGKVVRDVEYRPELIIDAYPLLRHLHPSLYHKIRTGHGVKSGEAVLTGESVSQYLRLADEGGNTVLQMKTGDAESSFQTVQAFKGKPGESLEQMVAGGIVLPRSLRNLDDEAEKYFTKQEDKARAYGVDLVAYEGGQHLAAAIWGPFRANLNNRPLIALLSDMNRSPEIADLYRYWFDAWRKASGALFAHYADIGMSSRYGSWGVISYLGEDDRQQYRLGVLREENRRGPWWKEERGPDDFLRGVRLTASAEGEHVVGTTKADILMGIHGGERITAGPGDDTLYAAKAGAVVEAGPGDDTILIASPAVTIEGGEGTDTVKVAMSLATLNLSDLKAGDIAIVDTRNAARTELIATPADVVRLTRGDSLRVFAETADRLRLPGFEKQGTGKGDRSNVTTYRGSAGGRDITLSVTTDLPPGG